MKLLLIKQHADNVPNCSLTHLSTGNHRQLSSHFPPVVTTFTDVKPEEMRQECVTREGILPRKVLISSHHCYIYIFHQIHFEQNNNYSLDLYYTGEMCGYAILYNHQMCE